MTNARGQVFVSYRRTYINDINTLIADLGMRGVPIWRDVDSLTVSEPTEDAIRAALESPDTSGAVLWLTPNVIDSPLVREVEVPLAVKRRKEDDGFWLIVVLTGGLDYADVSTLLAGALGPTDLSFWNLKKTPEPDAAPADITGFAAEVVRERIVAIAAGATAGVAGAEAEPQTEFTVAVDAKGTAALNRTGRDLYLNWTKQFAAGPPDQDAWARLSSAAGDVAQTVKASLSDKGLVVMDGTPSLPAAVLLGAQFSVRDRVTLKWRQNTPNGDTMDDWVISEGLTSKLALDRGWKVKVSYQDASATAIALCVNINSTTGTAIGRTADLPASWRATVSVDPPARRNVMDEPLDPDEAVSLVLAVVTKLREARDEVNLVTEVHAFLAAPAGFGVLLGTRIATLPPVVTYEYVTETQCYAPAVKVIS